MREAKAERAELRDTVKDLLRSSPEAVLPRHASQVMQAMRDMRWLKLRKTYGKIMEKPMENHILSYFMGKTMEKLWVSCRFSLKSTQWY